MLTLPQVPPSNLIELEKFVYATIKQLNQPFIIQSIWEEFINDEKDYQTFLQNNSFIHTLDIFVIPIYSNWCTFVEDAMILDNPLPLLQMVCTPSNEEKCFFPLILTFAFGLRCVHLVQTDSNYPKLCHVLAKSRSMQSIIHSLNNLSNVDEVNQIKKMLMDLIKTHHPFRSPKWILNHPEEAKELYFSIVELVFIIFVMEDFTRFSSKDDGKILDTREILMKQAFPSLHNNTYFPNLFADFYRFRMSVLDVCYKNRKFKIGYSFLLKGLNNFFASYVKQH